MEAREDVKSTLQCEAAHNFPPAGNKLSLDLREQSPSEPEDPSPGYKIPLRAVPNQDITLLLLKTQPSTLTYQLYLNKARTIKK